MIETGNRNGAPGLEALGLNKLKSVHWNLSPPELYEAAINRSEGLVTAGGALAVDTGSYTGRAAGDKYVVRDETTENVIWWNANKAIAPAHFDRLLDDFRAHAVGGELFVQDLFAGADADTRLGARVMSEYAWHSLFIRNLLIRPDQAQRAGFQPDVTVIDLPSFRADPDRHGCTSETIVACDLQRRIVLIGGTSYAGEMKKSVFTILNYLLPPQGVMPMHCSANMGADGDVALFFGLSGTGKTTLSADPSRTLIGDDEHGWGEHGIFNFEGGCYAKTIRLSAAAEPQIYATTQRFGTVLENVVLGPDRIPDFDDGSKTENSRCAYPLDFIDTASATGIGGHPANVIMLTADAFGVLPPIARLTPAEAMYHFLSGYTAKVAGTEKGVVEPEATFSACFGAPFMPRHPAEYGSLLRDLIARHGSDCWLVNTGWTGGAYGIGTRMPIKATRAVLTAALDGSLKNAEFRPDANFGFSVPVAVDGVESAILDPRSTWDDGTAYDAQAARLVDMFTGNFTKFEAHVDAATRDAAPGLRVAAQ